MLTIFKFPNLILRERMPEFDFSNPPYDPVQLEKDMIETMFHHKGIGLSANQVGIKTRVFTMGFSSDPSNAKAYFNPMVVKHVDTVNDMEEGCLSFPGIYVKIKRPAKILARWQNSKGEWIESEFDGYDCKCFLHELDHLEGIVFKDRVSQIKWDLEIKRLQKRNKK